jgi:hypothetical protein
MRHALAPNEHDAPFETECKELAERVAAASVETLVTSLHPASDREVSDQCRIDS